MQLKDRRCVPCEGGTPPLDDGQTRLFLGEVQGWELVRSAGQPPRIRKLFKFDDFLG